MESTTQFTSCHLSVIEAKPLRSEVIQTNSLGLESRKAGPISEEPKRRNPYQYPGRSPEKS